MTLFPQAPCDILVIEDDAAISFVLTHMLSDNGYRVHAAVDGQDALDYLDRAASVPRLILLDLMMPNMNGFAFRELQCQDSRLKTIPVVILSAISQRLDPRQLADLDAVAFLGKPIDWARLEQIVACYCPI